MISLIYELVLVLSQLNVILLVVHNAVNAQTQSPLAKKYDLCQKPNSPSQYPTSFSPAIIASRNAADKAKSLATKWFHKELNRSYSSAIQDFKWKLIDKLPKSINKPTDPNYFKYHDDKLTLEKTYNNLIRVRDAVILRGYAAEYEYDAAIFDDLLTELVQIISELESLLPLFNVTFHSTPFPSPKAFAESKTEHQYKDWIIFHDYIVLVEYTHDFIEDLQNRNCGII